jgi:hypothetical protein
MPKGPRIATASASAGQPNARPSVARRKPRISMPTDQHQPQTHAAKQGTTGHHALIQPLDHSSSGSVMQGALSGPSGERPQTPAQRAVRILMETGEPEMFSPVNTRKGMCNGHALQQPHPPGAQADSRGSGHVCPPRGHPAGTVPNSDWFVRYYDPRRRPGTAVGRSSALSRSRERTCEVTGPFWARRHSVQRAARRHDSGSHPSGRTDR